MPIEWTSVVFLFIFLECVVSFSDDNFVEPIVSGQIEYTGAPVALLHTGTLVYQYATNPTCARSNGMVDNRNETHIRIDENCIMSVAIPLN